MDGWMSDVTLRLKRLESMLSGGGGMGVSGTGSGVVLASSAAGSEPAGAVAANGTAKPRAVSEWDVLMTGAAADFRAKGAAIGGR